MFFATGADRRFRAYDRDNGKEVWSIELPAASEGMPATYEVNGRQFIVVPVASGTGQFAARFGGPRPGCTGTRRRGWRRRAAGGSASGRRAAGGRATGWRWTWRWPRRCTRRASGAVHGVGVEEVTIEDTSSSVRSVFELSSNDGSVAEHRT